MILMWSGFIVISYLTTGAGLGVNAGLSPGPLQALIIAESLQGGWPAGFRVAVAPLFTDTLFALPSLLIASRLPDWALSVISVVGGGVIIWMGVGTLRAGAPAAAETATGPLRRSLFKGILTNLLNPNAYLFWLTIGGPMLLDAFRQFGWVGPALFLAPLYAMMVLVNMALSLAVSRGRRFLQGSLYLWTLRGSGALLLALGAWRAWVGLLALR